MPNNIDSSSGFNNYNQFIKERSSFQGDPSALSIQDSSIANKATDVAKDVKEDPMKQVPYYAACGVAGVGLSWLVDKFVRKICTGDTYENSSLQKTINGISNNSVLNKIDGIITWTAAKPGNLYNGYLKNNRVFRKLFGWVDNKEVKQAFAQGRTKKLPPLVGFPIMESGAAMEMEAKVKHLLDNDMLVKIKGKQYPNLSVELKRVLGLAGDMPIADFNFNNPDHIKTIKEQVRTILEKQDVLKKGLAGKELKAFENALKDLGSYSNKMTILENLSKKGASPIAKALSKLIIGTGHIMGGTLGMIVLGGGLAVGLSIKNAFDAKPGERFSTLMEDILSGWVGGFLLLTPVYKIVNGISGLSGLEGKGIKNGLLRKTGWLVGVGQGTFHNLREAKGLMPKLKAFGKVLVPGVFPGGLLRFALVAGVCMFGAAELLKKVSHKLFGKPSPKPEEIEAERKAKEEEEKKKAELSKKPAVVNKASNNNEDIKDYLNKAKTGQPIVPVKPEDTGKPAVQKTEEPKPESGKQKDNYTYVPQVKPFSPVKDMQDIDKTAGGYQKVLSDANNAFKEINPNFNQKSLEIKPEKSN